MGQPEKNQPQKGGAADLTTQYMDLHPSEKKLIEAIRDMDDGEIEVLKIQNALPVIYKISLKTERFSE